nr:hypothetical protein [Lachnospiraceae bacterium]
MARKIDKNEGKLSDDSKIYDKEFEEKKLSPKERFKNMTFKEKVSYFNYYYLKGIIVFLVVAVLLFISVKDYFTQDKVIVKIVILNSAYDDAEIEKMEKKI